MNLKKTLEGVNKYRIFMSVLYATCGGFSGLVLMRGYEAICDVQTKIVIGTVLTCLLMLFSFGVSFYHAERI